MDLLLAVDIHRQPGQTLQQARPWLARTHARVDLVYADPFGDGDSWLRWLSDDPALKRAWARVRDDEREQLEALLDHVPAEARGKAFVAAGQPGRTIARLAERYDATIIGTHEHTVVGWWFGSQAERIARTSPKPVLVLRPSVDVRGPRRALLAVDLHRDNRALIATAGTWATAFGLTVDLFYADETRFAVSNALDTDSRAMLERYRADVRTEYDRLLAQIRASLPEACRGAVVVGWGPAADAILDHASGYDLLIVGPAHDTSVLVWLGSVAERLVRRARTSVLVVK